jgi:pimeloyl-ACP methyl ester carboxylesterase
MRDLQGAPIPLEIRELETAQGHLRYIRTRPRGLPKLMLIHGAPGSFEAWERYYLDQEILERWDIIAVDRPGYGASNQGQAILPIQDQSRLLWEAAELEGGQKVLLVSHSFGGPISAWMAITQPEKTLGLILLAPSMSAEAEPIFWFNYLTGVPPLYWLFAPGAKKQQ